MSLIKKLLTSKINVTAMLLMLVAVKDFLDNYDFAGLTNARAYIVFGLGLLIVIFRTYFTNTHTNENRTPGSSNS